MKKIFCKNYSIWFENLHYNSESEFESFFITHKKHQNPIKLLFFLLTL